ncbi:MAG: hypothetical protein JOZ19_02230 [Rubrobacter sp.]|nr:hypothetical protein [Rubrobacter sp.]
MLNNPELEKIRQEHILYVTGTCRAADDPPTVIVVMEMENLKRAREFAQSNTLSEARRKASAIGLPEGVWYDESRVT